jgi:hypothetical protein
VDHYHIWVNLRPGVKDLEFAERVERYMAHLRSHGTIEGHSLARRKLGFGPKEIGEWHIVVRVTDLAQLDRTFNLAATRAGETEKLHAAVFACVTDFSSALYRDFPDPVRVPKPSA